jgi:four helix bundle protein
MKDEGDLRDRTKSFALRIVRLFRQLANTGDAQVIGKQLLRSGTSVGANYLEACRSRSDAEFVAKIGDCLKELDETAYWLELVVGAEIVPEAKMADLLDETNQLLAVFTAISKNTKKRMAAS